MAELDTKMAFAKLQSCENIWRPFQLLEWGMLVGKSNVCGQGGEALDTEALLTPLVTWPQASSFHCDSYHTQVRPGKEHMLWSQSDTGAPSDLRPSL